MSGARRFGFGRLEEPAAKVARWVETTGPHRHVAPGHVGPNVIDNSAWPDQAAIKQGDKAESATIGLARNLRVTLTASNDQAIAARCRRSTRDSGAGGY